MSNLISPQSGESCTEAQFLAEKVVQREINKKKIIVCKKWWNSSPWKKKYALQVIAANSLLKIFSFKAIINALDKKECLWIWSLKNKDLVNFISEEQDKIDKVNESVENAKKIETLSTTSFEKVKYGKQSKLDKLRD